MITIYADEDSALEIIINRMKRFESDREYQNLYEEYFKQVLLSGGLDNIDLTKDIDNFVINDTLIYDDVELSYNEMTKDDDRILYQSRGLFLVNARQ